MEHRPINLIQQRNSNIEFVPSGLRLILYCLRNYSLEDKGESIAALCGRDFDWNSFISLVEHHRVTALVQQALNRFGAHIIPHAVMGILKERRLRKARETLSRTGLLIRILSAIQKEGIQVLPFKGPVLSQQVYGELGIRHVGDLDIMVAPDQVMAAQEVLLGQDLIRSDPEFALTRKQTLDYIRNNHHFGFFFRKHEIRVELDWRLGHRYVYPFEFDELWGRRSIIRILGVEVETLSPEHNMLLLCAHGAGHSWFRLFWVNDIARLLTQSYVMDWKSLISFAKRLGIARMVAEGVVLANRFLGSPMPEPVSLVASEDSGVERIVRMASYLLCRPDGPSYKPFSYPYIASKIHGLLLRSDLRYKTAFVALHMRSSYGDWDKLPLPDVLFPLYYLTRPFFWFFRWYTPNIKVYRQGTKAGTHDETH
jgi:hypothetical protein